MKWFTESHELGVFMISFVIVVTGIRGDEENRVDAEQDPFEHRVDAEQDPFENRVDAGQDPFEKVTLADDGGAHSILFGRCLAASRTLEVKLYSIELPPAPGNPGKSEEFIRYVPDSSQLAVLPVWKTATSNPPVAKIVECAAAAQSGGNAMFKYSGGSDCKVSNQSYDLKYTPACDAEEHEAVFISNAVVVGCPLPGIPLKASTTEPKSMCVTVHTEPLFMTDTSNICFDQYSFPFSGPTEFIAFNDIVKILKDKKVESSNFYVWTAHAAGQPWTWRYGTPIDTALMVGTPPTSLDYLAFMKGAADFKLDFAPQDTFMGGVVCLKPF